MDSTVYLKRPVRTQRLLFSFNRSFMVKEVEVFGGKNVALWKETSQSSTYENSSNYASDKAVDGWDSDHYFFNNTCIHTELRGDNPFWSVMLGDFYRILSVYISNREDRSERINGFTVHVKTASGEERLIYTDKQQSKRKDIWIDSSYMPNELVNEVIIRGDNINHEKIINLCEVYVLACIPSKNETSECTQLFPENCHPSFDKMSDNLACPACLSGWTGDYCDIKKEHRYCKYHKGRTIDNKGNCTRREHCLGEFRKSDGQCTSPKNQCEPGWMGPGCQYVNLAYRSSSSIASLDGSLNTSEQILEIQIEFNGSFIISALIIHGKQSNNVTIKTPKNETCYMGNIKEGSHIVFCNFILRTRSLFISFLKKQTVMEIEVFGGRNVALWKKTTQSSIYNNTLTSPDKAVDGWDSGGDLFNDSCTHTYEKHETNGPFWNVDLGSPYSIMSVRIANRNKYEQRINGFRLFGLNFTNLRQLMYTDPGNATSRSSVWVDSSIMTSSLYHTIIIDGEYLVKNESRYQILALCEVEVFACRLTENRGEDCVSFCPKNCQQTEKCLNKQFTCPNCNPGWKGPHCTQGNVFLF
ncbi:uncharacterized protein LOC134243461 [Saccostrea cucullata]|uniref:uncharacterized protein LOC134243461 n=1 Tax=Saccostrea cuccullata TaxID=36930 RepID=UPI002ED4A516